MKNDLTVIGQNIKLELTQSKVVTPADYSLENAMKSAYLILQETVDRNKRPALEVCTPNSIHNALLDMAVQGLSPAKKQCYFIVYGQQLQMQRSYMGAQAVAKRVDPRIADIRAEIIYEDDQFDYAIVNGKKLVKLHTQSLKSIMKNAIIGAYAVAVDDGETPLHTEIMTFEEIKQAWKQSKMNTVLASGTINADSTHGKFSGEMAKKTVINRLCKKIINTSTDATLLESVEQTDEEADFVQAEVNRNQARIPLDFKPSEPAQAPDPEKAIRKAAPPEPTENPFCTMDQRRKIIDLENVANRGKDASIANISGFVGREITSTKELTAAEAANYIETLTLESDMIRQAEEPGMQDAPAWGAD